MNSLSSTIIALSGAAMLHCASTVEVERPNTSDRIPVNFGSREVYVGRNFYVGTNQAPSISSQLFGTKMKLGYAGACFIGLGLAMAYKDGRGKDND